MGQPGFLLLLLLLTGSCLPALAADRPNVLIMGMDEDQASVERDSQVFRRVLDALANEMHDVGFDVYDESALSFDGYRGAGIGRSDAELIEVARSIQRPPIDILVIFALYTETRFQRKASEIHSRVEGRLLNVRTGQRLGNVEVASPVPWLAPANCQQQCLASLSGDYSRRLAGDLGKALAQKLAWQITGDPAKGDVNDSRLATAFNLVFDGFAPADVMAMEEYLAVFSGYQSHRPVYVSSTRQEYWYQSRIPSAKLYRNLQKLLTQLGLRGMVQFSGSTFTVQQVNIAARQRPPVAGQW